MAHQKYLEALKAEFDPSLIELRDGPSKKIGNEYKVQQLKYINIYALQDRLDEVFPLQWSWQILESTVVKVEKETKKWNKETQSQEIVGNYFEDQVVVRGRLSVCIEDKDVVREAFGGCNLTYGAQPGDSYKIADSNAFRKAALKFGMGAYLADEEEVYKSKGGNNWSNNQKPKQQQEQKADQPAKKNPFK